MQCLYGKELNWNKLQRVGSSLDHLADPCAAQTERQSALVDVWVGTPSEA